MWLFKKREGQSDEELVASYFKSGDQSLLGLLFERHVQTVYGVCLYYLRDKDQAKDAVMQIFENMSTSLRSSEVRNFKGWLSFVVRNFCINELRKLKNRHYVPEHYLDFEFQQPVLEEEERIAAVDEEMMLTHLQAALPQLKEKQRICVELFYLKGLSYEETASKTGYAVNEVKSYIQNGKRNLKICMEQNERSEGRY